MDFSEIKKFVIERGDRFIMIEDGKPAVVLMSFSDYAKLSVSRASRAIIPDAAEGFDLPLQADGWEATDAPETELVAEASLPAGMEVQPVAVQRRLDQIRLEDLPL